MNKNTKTFLLVLGVAAVGWMGWQAWKKKQQSDAVEAAKKEELKAGSTAPATSTGAQVVKDVSEGVMIPTDQVTSYATPIEQDTISNVM